MTKTTEIRIQAFLDHYTAYKAWQLVEDQFDQLAKVFNQDNNCYLLDTPWQAMVEAAIKAHEPDIWEWYEWWLLVAAEGQGDYEYAFEDADGTTHTYNTGTQSLQEFLTTIAEHYE